MSLKGGIEDSRSKQVPRLTNLEDLLAQNASKLTHNLSVRATLNNAVNKEDEKYFSKQVYAFFTNESHIPMLYKQCADYCLADDTRETLKQSDTALRPEAIMVDTERSVHTMQNSGLGRDILSVIWQRVSRTSSDGRLCKFEFYIALALIAEHQQHRYVRSLEELLTYQALPEPFLTLKDNSTSTAPNGETSRSHGGHLVTNSVSQPVHTALDNVAPISPGDDEFGDFADFRSASPSQFPAQVQHDQLQNVNANEQSLVDFVSDQDKYAALRGINPSVSISAASVAPVANKTIVSRANVRDHLVAPSTPSTISNSDEHPDSNSRTPSDWSSAPSASASADASRHESPMHRAIQLNDAPETFQRESWKANEVNGCKHADTATDWAVFTSVKSTGNRVELEPVLEHANSSDLLGIDFSSVSTVNAKTAGADSIEITNSFEKKKQQDRTPHVVSEDSLNPALSKDVVQTRVSVQSCTDGDDDDFDDFRVASCPVAVAASGFTQPSLNSIEPVATGTDCQSLSQIYDGAKPEDAASEVEQLHKATANADDDLSVDAPSTTSKRCEDSDTDVDEQRLIVWNTCICVAEQCITECDTIIDEVKDELTFQHLCLLPMFEVFCNDLAAIYNVALRIRRSADALRVRLDSAVAKISASVARQLADMEDTIRHVELRWSRLTHRCELLSTIGNDENDSESSGGIAYVCKICLQPVAGTPRRTVVVSSHYYHLECANVYMRKGTLQTLSAVA